MALYCFKIMKDGWDKYRKEGINELKRIAASKFFANKPTQVEILNTYINVYKTKTERNIKGTVFFQDREIEEANKNASKFIKEIRINLEEFYKTDEGKESDFEVYFIAQKRNYRLGIRPQKIISESQIKPLDSISYIEHLHFEFKYRPLLYKIISIVLIALAVVFSIVGFIFIAVKKEATIIFFIVGLLCLLIGFLLWFIGLALLKLPERKFTFLILKKYFLRLSNENIILSSYSGTCPICSGKVELSYSRLKLKGYIANCQNNPDGHIFSFDHTSFTGERL